MSPERERRRLLLAIHLLECPECGPAGAASVLRANPEAETPEELDPRRPEAARSASWVETEESGIEAEFDRVSDLLEEQINTVLSEKEDD